jgi:two-component system cell cycle response regulator CtrA
MRIILASDQTQQPKVLDDLGPALTTLGVVVDRLEQAADLPSSISLSGPFDLALVLFDAPSRDTLMTLRTLRRCGMTIPLIALLAGRPSAEAEEAALQAGADDVAFYPMRLSVLHARMQALARRARGYACPELRCGNVLLEQDLHQVSVDGRPVQLTAREFDFLETLILHKSVLLTKERFMTSLYADGSAPDSKIVDVFVCKLRRKLKAAGAAEMIRTVWGRGYLAFEPALGAIQAARSTHRPETLAEPAPRGWMRRAERLQHATPA